MGNYDRSAYNETPLPGNFNVWGNAKGEDPEKALKKVQRKFRKKAKLYHAGKCKGCKHLKFKRSSIYGNENVICNVWDKNKCPQGFGRH